MATAPYSYETSKTSASVNWKPGAGNGRHITGITLHWWGSSLHLDFDGIVNFLCSPRPANPTSAHYVAQGKDQNGKVSARVACIVDPEDIAYACGNWNGNLTTISIECRPNCTAEDREVVAQLVAKLRSQYGHLPLYPHSHWTSTACPGAWAPHLGEISARADAINAGAVAPKPPTPPAAVATTVALTVDPPVVPFGYSHTLTARVTPAAATGSVQWQWNRGDGKWASFGKPAKVTSGIARLVNRPGVAVDHHYRAVFTPATSAFKAATSREVVAPVVDLLKLRQP
jgi:hypothetical protein